MIIVVFVYLLALACWMGGMIFFTAIVAPVVFQVLPAADRGNFLGELFPRFYILGYVAGGIAVLLAAYITIVRPPRLWWSIAAIALAVALGLTVYSGVVIRPRVHSLRTVVEQPNPDPDRKAEFDRLHRLSMILSGGALVLNLVALLSSATALAPRS